MLRRFGTFLKKYERHWSSIAFAIGFIWDNLTLTRVDLLYDNIVLTSYLVIAAACIILFHAHGTGRIRLGIVERVSPYLPLAIQFAFGGLFSGYVVYYSRSGSFIESWPFLIFLLALFVGNEIFKKRYQLLTFQIAIFFITAFSYFTFAIPVLLRAIGPVVFILSGFVSLMLVISLISLVRRAAPERVLEARAGLFATILGIYALFNFAYFTNVIPPIPLTIKHIGVYHAVTKLPTGDFELSYEPAPWYRIFKEASDTFHKEEGRRVYVFSAVFAPRSLETTIVHEWSFYDREKETWVSRSAISFPITGGRGDGFRGYTYKDTVEPGVWRVDVKTKQGQVIGRMKFKVENADGKIKLKTLVK